MGGRYPFLLVDRVLELEMQKYCIAYKNVTVNDNFFTGHFPERKIMPGRAPSPPATVERSILLLALPPPHRVPLPHCRTLSHTVCRWLKRAVDARTAQSPKW